MNKLHSIPSELLQSFVDDELDVYEHQYVLDAQVKYDDIAKEICELRKLKDLMKAVRPVESELPGSLDIPKQTWLSLNHRPVAIPAFLMLMLVVITSVFVGQNKNNQIVNADLTYPDVKAFVSASPVNVNVILHLNRDDERSAKQLFVQLEQLLTTDKMKNNSFRVEIVASGPGLSLVRKNKSSAPEKIRDISKKYDNVVFVACQSTLNRLIKVINRKVDILPEAMLTASGPDLIRLRKSQGWAYIKI